MTATVCMVPRCPLPAYRKGRCQQHAPANDGYEPGWRERSLAMRRANPQCQRCGSASDLTVDHVAPHSSALGYRVLCRSCHAVIGAKGSAPAIRVESKTPAACGPTSGVGQVKQSRPLLRIVG